MNEIIENLNEVRGRVWNFDRSLELAIGALNDSAECHGIVAVISDRDSIISDLADSIEKHNTGNRVWRSRGEGGGGGGYQEVEGRRQWDSVSSDLDGFFSILI